MEGEERRRVTGKTAKKMKSIIGTRARAKPTRSTLRAVRKFKESRSVPLPDRRTKALR